MARLEYDRPFQKHLRPGEKLLWVGRPVQGVLFRTTDWSAVPFALIWTAMATWLCGRAFRQGLNALLNPCPTVAVFGVLAVGLYLLVGRFFVDARQRRRTWYALTDRRALILYVGKRVCFNAVEGPDCKEVKLIRHADGSGTIVFELKEVDPYWAGREGRGGVLDETRPSGPAFEAIDAADEVHALLRTNPAFADALDRAAAPPPPPVAVHPQWFALAFLLVALSVVLAVGAYCNTQSYLRAGIPPGRGAVVVNPGAANEQYCLSTGDGRPDRSQPVTKDQYLAYARLHARSRDALKFAGFIGVMLALWVAPFLKRPARAAVRKARSTAPFLSRLWRSGTGA